MSIPHSPVTQHGRYMRQRALRVLFAARRTELLPSRRERCLPIQPFFPLSFFFRPPPLVMMRDYRRCSVALSMRVMRFASCAARELRRQRCKIYIL
jgi:hypothetical protein